MGVSNRRHRLTGSNGFCFHSQTTEWSESPDFDPVRIRLTRPTSVINRVLPLRWRLGRSEDLVQGHDSGPKHLCPFSGLEKLGRKSRRLSLDLVEGQVVDPQ